MRQAGVRRSSDGTMKTTNVVHASIAAALAAPLYGHAQSATPADGLPTVVVTATRSPQSAVDLVTDVSVIGPRRLRDTAQGSLADELDREPGIETIANGGPGAATGVLLRGANAGQTLTLIEGFRIGSGTLGSTSFQGLAPARFDRVEILRGPASSFYGADAIGGVVQLFLPRGAGPVAASVDAAAGNYHTRAANAAVNGRSGRFDYSLSMGHARSEGFNTSKPGNFSFNPDRDGYERSNAAANMNFAVTPDHSVGVVLYSDRLTTQFDDGPAFAGASTRQRTQLVGLRSSHALGDSVRVSLRAGDTLDDNENVSRFPGRFESRQRQYAVDGEWLLSRSVTLAGGLERLEQDVASSSYGPGTPPGRTTNSVRAALFVNTNPHILQLSLRHDDNSQYGARTTGGLAYGYRLTTALRVGGGVSTGFRAPSFNDLYFPAFGRPEIRPETSRNVELGAYWDTPATTARAVLYRNQVRDLVVFAPTCPDPSPQFRFGCADNVNRARLEGLSIGATHRVGDTRLQVALDLQRPMDETLDKRLPRRATRQASFAIDQAVGRALVGMEWLVSGARFDDASNTQRMGGFGVVNLRAELPLSGGLSLFARANNVLDKNYETARLFATPGANLLVGLRYAGR